MIQKSVIGNGVRILTEAMPQVVSSSIGIWVENGSRYEEPAENGTSHFIEHLLFKGTKKRTAAQIAEAFDAVGGVLNAFTGKEYTCYYAKVLGKDLEMATEVLADIFLESVFDPEEIERERQVVLQEISQAEDTPDDFIHDLFNEEFWKGHPLALPIFGSVATVNKIDREQLMSFMAARYRSSRVFIAAAGQVEHERLTAKCAGLFGGVAGDGKVEKFSPPIDHPLVLDAREETRAGAHLHRRPRHQPVASPALRSLRAEHRARRRDVLAAVPGSAREARPRLQHLLVHLVVHRLGLLRCLRRHQSRMGRRSPRSHDRRAA